MLKAYRELDHEGLVEARRGQGTFVSRTLQPTAPAELRGPAGGAAALARAARKTAGLDEDDIAALVAATLQAAFARQAA